MNDPPTSIRYDVEVLPSGRIELQVPMPVGSRVTVFVVESLPGMEDDLPGAAMSSTDFWDNPEDDEDWNDA